MSLRIACISDIHMGWDHLIMPKQEEADVLLFTGDGTNSGTEREIIRLNEWLEPLRYKHKIYVPGNHDILFEEDEGLARQLLSSCTVLIDQQIEIDGKIIYGTPWTPTYGDWAFMKPDLNLIKVFENIPNRVDVLAAHGPPYCVLDQNYRGDLCGSMALYQAIVQKNPRFVVFGHIHESYGTHSDSYTTYVNAACPYFWKFAEDKQRQPIIIEV